MTDRYAEIAFSAEALRRQRAAGSIRAWGAPRSRPTCPDLLGVREREFLAGLDAFVMASRTPDGWPYVQHRGGSPGFLHVLDGSALAFADHAGNGQFVTVANLAGDDRVCLLCIDHARGARMKVLARARVVEGDAALLRRLEVTGGSGRVILLTVEAIDWNCSRHLPIRLSERQAGVLARRYAERLEDRIGELEDEIAELRSR